MAKKNQDMDQKASCVSEGGREGRAGSPLPAAARAECAPYHQSVTHHFENAVEQDENGVY